MDAIGKMLSELGIYWPKLIMQTVNFAIVYFILARFAYKPVLALLDKRRKTIEESLQNAERIKIELADAEETRKRIIQEASDKSAQIVAEAQASAAALSEKKIQETVAQAEALILKAREATELDRQKMMNELRAEIGRLVVETTGKVTGKILTLDDQKRLAEETTKQLAA